MGEREQKKLLKADGAAPTNSWGHETTWHVQRTLRTSTCLFIGRCRGVVAEKTWRVSKSQITHPLNQYLLSTYSWRVSWSMLRSLDFIQTVVSNYWRIWESSDSICVLEISSLRLGSGLCRWWQDWRQIEVT